MEIIHSFFIFYSDGLCVPSLKKNRKKRKEEKMLNKNEAKEKEKT